MGLQHSCSRFLFIQEEYEFPEWSNTKYHTSCSEVSCILGVNLTDADLVEYLEQLAATDGSSTMPQAVHRVLNYKACRKGAIMFGDTLLPSKCSLIVEELRKTSLCFPIATLMKNRDVKSWHGLRREDINLERAMQRLDSARG
ncbi:hypothetical protein Droror1_Dr00006488 [Drosera rotundifolia]